MQTSPSHAHASRIVLSGLGAALLALGVAGCGVSSTANAPEMAAKGPDVAISADEEEAAVADGVESSLRASLRGVIERYRQESGGGEAKFLICATEHDEKGDLSSTKCSGVEP